MKKLSIMILVFIMGGLVVEGYAQSGEKGTSRNKEFNVIDSRGDSVICISSDTHSGRLTISAGGLELLLSNKNKGEAPKSESVRSKKPAKEVKIRTKRKDYDSRLAAFELGMNEFRQPDYSLYAAEQKGFLDLNNAQSIHFSLNLFQAGIALDRRQIIGFSSGIGFTWNNYVLSESYTLSRQDGMLKPQVISESYQKSKITTFGFRMPLTMDINIGDAFISAGAYGEVILNSYTKIKRPVSKNHLNYVNPFQGGLTARLGYGNFYVYGIYSLTDFFEKGKGPETQMATIGIGIGL